MDYVADAHALVWYFMDDSRLGQNALYTFEQTEETGMIIVPAIVLAEVMYISQKGRIPITFEETLLRLETRENYHVAALDIDILRVAADIDGFEMHDKLIVATALYFRAPLITRDEQITQSGIVRVIW